MSSSDPSSAGQPQPSTHRLVINSIDQGFCVVEVLFNPRGEATDYRFLETNPAFDQQTGLAHAVGRSMRELAPDHEAYWYEIYGEVARTGKPRRTILEARALHRWFDVYAFRIDAPDLHRVAILFTDITDRTRSEHGARVLADLSDALLALTHEAELPALVRARAGAYFGLSQCALLEIDLDRQVATVHRSWDHPDAPSVAGNHRFPDFVGDAIWQDTIAGRTVVVDDIEHDARVSGPERFRALRVGSFLATSVRKIDARRHVLMLARPGPSTWRADEIELAQEIGVRCWTRVERLRAELALSASEERLRLILENAREYAIFTMDVDRRVTSWSEGAQRLLGFRPEDILGRSADEIFTPEDVAAGEPAREAGRAMTEGRASNERWHLRKDGSRFWGSGAMMVMQDHEGATQGLLKIMRDQTDVRLAQEALVNSQRQLQDALDLAQRARADAEGAMQARDRFLAALSHELRTPLSPVLMIAGERAHDETVPEPIRREFATIRSNIELEARLIDDMLDLNRIARGKLTLHRLHVDLHAVLREVTEMVRAAAAEKGQTLTLDLRSPHAAVEADAARLKQIFLNLLNNAIKFTPDRGIIEVTTALAENAREILVQVVDNGLGMTEEELTRAFQPFTQGDHTRVASPHSYGGLGLGLAIVHELVGRHGGRVTARSRGRGQGAVFSVHLPLTNSMPTLPAPGQPAATAAATEGLRILLVEDHLHTRLAMERMLKRRNHQVVTASSQREAVDLATRQPFDVLVSDIGLPDGDGYQLVTALRTIRPAIRAIALSGYGMESDVSRSAAAGFAVHLTKPVTMPRLEAAIAQIVGQA